MKAGAPGGGAPVSVFSVRSDCFLLGCMKSLCILEINPKSDVRFASVSSRFVGCLFFSFFGAFVCCAGAVLL